MFGGGDLDDLTGESYDHQTMPVGKIGSNHDLTMADVPSEEYMNAHF